MSRKIDPSLDCSSSVRVHDQAGKGPSATESSATGRVCFKNRSQSRTQKYLHRKIYRISSTNIIQQPINCNPALRALRSPTLMHLNPRVVFTRLDDTSLPQHTSRSVCESAIMLLPPSQTDTTRFQPIAPLLSTLAAIAGPGDPSPFLRWHCGTRHAFRAESR